jgi:SWI/SNF-related matrix-associated actin-dependent regulator 1 of chromatin subfamily A
LRNIFHHTKNKIAVEFDFDRAILEKVKSLGDRKWNPTKKRWEVTITTVNLDSVLDFAIENGFSIAEDALALFEDVALQREKLFAPLEDFEYSVPESITATLRPYQVEVVKRMVQWKRCLNGSEQGTGKTLETITALESLNAFPALIITKASLKDNFANEFSKFLPNRKVKIIEAKDEIYSGADVYILNYDIIAKKEKRLIEMDFKAFVADESHYLKNSKAARSKSAKKIAKKIDVRFLLTGTPIEKSPSELINQINILDRMDDMGGYNHFIHHYCDAHQTRFGFDISGATNLKELHKTMKQLFYVRVNKSDVLAELPDKQYQDLIVELDNEKEYREAEYELVNYLQQKILTNGKIKEAIKGLDKEEAKEARLKVMSDVEDRVGGAEHLVKLSVLKQVALKGKLSSADEWIEDFITSGKKLIVFFNHKEACKHLTDKFDMEFIDGSVPNKKRQLIVDRFQEDPKRKLLALNIESGGTGYNITSACDGLFIEEPWNPSKKEQCEDRMHRIGQKFKVNIYTMLAKRTIDFDINELLKEKGRITKAVNAGIEVEETVSRNIMNDVLSRLLENTS